MIMATTFLTIRYRLIVFLVILYHFILFNGYAQTSTINGRVIDSETNEGLPYANVFINLSTLGTATDENGNFNLLKIPYGVHELVVSYIGYTSYSTKIKTGPENLKYLEIRLVPKDAELSEVQVKGERDKEWQTNLKKFETIFLGTTTFAKSCEILNPWVLEFNADVNKAFYATASQPLEVQNLSLGYKIFYYLTGFISTNEAYNIRGQIRFEELVTTDEKQALTWQQNRATAYLGSYRHLFKAIIEGRTKEEGFALYYHTANTSLVSRADQSKTFASLLGNSIKQYTSDEIVRKELPNEEYQLQLSPKTEVHYTKSYSGKRVYSDVTFPVSWLEVRDGMLRVARNGVVLTPANMVVSGVMYDMRVANLLPENYSQNDKVNVDKQVDYTVDKMIALQEKVYLHTDKEYYYPGETIWFKAYMNYRSPEIMDSLSRVLYVELIDSSGKIIQTKVLPIEDGMASNAIVIDELQEGNYYLRAYTNWMLNYDHKLIFVKVIPILDLHSQPELLRWDSISNAYNTELRLVTKNLVFKPRAEIHLDFELKDSIGNPILASLSISVTDTQKVINLPENNILSRNFLQRNDFNKSLIPTYPIESGISISGKYRDRKGKPHRTRLIIVMDDLSDMTIVETDSKGEFWTSGFQFNDSSKVGFISTDKRKHLSGSVLLSLRETPPFSIPIAGQRFKLKKLEFPQRSKLSTSLTKDARLLNEVTIKGKKIVEPQGITKIYAKSDFEIKGKALAQSSRSSLVDALRGRIPGMTVVLSKEGNSYRNRIRLGGTSNFIGAQSTEPLLIIDGLQMAPDFGNPNLPTVHDQLMQINPTIVDNVEVIKYGGAAMYGSRGSNGVISINTTRFDLQQGISPNKASENIYFDKTTVLGYSQNVEFTAPDYSTLIDNGFPDNRTTIYWNPYITTDIIDGSANISFFSADMPSEYAVSVKGIDSTGKPISGVFMIKISSD